jgi:hypothetical protein
MSHQAYGLNTSMHQGVDISPAIYASHINKLPANYPSRESKGNLRELDNAYTTKAYGSGRTTNHYGNKYKAPNGTFDSRYPSIWRGLREQQFVRKLDDWEQAALSAALGVPWSPKEEGLTPEPASASGNEPEPASASGNEPEPAPESWPPIINPVSDGTNIYNLQATVSDDRKQLNISWKGFTYDGTQPFNIRISPNNKVFQATPSTLEENEATFTIIDDAAIPYAEYTINIDYLDKTTEFIFNYTQPDVNDIVIGLQASFDGGNLLISWQENNDIDNSKFRFIVDPNHFESPTFENGSARFNLRDDISVGPSQDYTITVIYDRQQVGEPMVIQYNKGTEQQGGIKKIQKSRKFRKHFRKTRKSYKE